MNPTFWSYIKNYFHRAPKEPIFRFSYINRQLAWNLTKTTNLTEDPSLNLISHRIRDRKKGRDQFQRPRRISAKIPKTYTDRQLEFERKRCESMPQERFQEALKLLRKTRQQPIAVSQRNEFSLENEIGAWNLQFAKSLMAERGERLGFCFFSVRERERERCTGVSLSKHE